MEDRTSLIRHSGKLSQKLELITGLPLHITLKRAVKQKHRTSKSRISFRRPQSNGPKLEEQVQWSSVGIPNGLQNADRHDALSASLWEDLLPSRRTWTQFLGHQKVEHGPQGGRNKKENPDCQTWEMEGKMLTTVPIYIKKEPKNGTTNESRQMVNALNYSLSQTPRILRKWMSSIFTS
jgi:hypothetical protein